MAEGHAGEVASPAHAHDNTAKCGADQVAKGLPHVEAFVRILPAAVDGGEMVGLTNEVFPCDLQVLVQVIGVSGLHIGILCPFFLE